MIATANAQAVVSSSSTGAQARIISTCGRPTNHQPTRRRWGRTARGGHNGDTLLDFTNNKQTDFDWFDRLSHLAVFPSNEILKRLEKELWRRGARKRKERKERVGMMMMMIRQRQRLACLIQIDETQMMEYVWRGRSSPVNAGAALSPVLPYHEMKREKA
jgi:hypothetical protein